MTFEEGLAHEAKAGWEVFEVAQRGAARFAGGRGPRRRGRRRLTSKNISVTQKKKKKKGEGTTNALAAEPGGQAQTTRPRLDIVEPCQKPRSACATCARATGPSRRCGGSRSRSSAARCSACSARTAPARPPPSRSSRATGTAAAARSPCWVATPRCATWSCAGASGSCCRAAASTRARPCASRSSRWPASTRSRATRTRRSRWSASRARRTSARSSSRAASSGGSTWRWRWSATRS